MFGRWRLRRARRSEPAAQDATGVRPLVDDAVSCAEQLQSLGERIDGFRRKGGAALGGDLGPEVGILRERQDEIVRDYLERTRAVEHDDPDALVGARRRLEEMYADTRDLVTGRALALVEAVLDRDRR